MVDHAHELSAEDAKEVHRLLAIFYQREPSVERYRLLTKVFFYAKARRDESPVCELEAENERLRGVLQEVLPECWDTPNAERIIRDALKD